MSKIKFIMLGMGLVLFMAGGLWGKSDSAWADREDSRIGAWPLDRKPSTVSKVGGEYQTTKHRPGGLPPGSPPSIAPPQPPQVRPPYLSRPQGIQTPRPSITHTRPPQWQLPPGWPKSMGFGPQPRHRPHHYSGYYRSRPNRSSESSLGFNAYWSGLYMGLSLGGQLNSSETRYQREETWSVWADPPVSPTPPAQPVPSRTVREEPVDNYNYQYEQWRKSWQ